MQVLQVVNPNVKYKVQSSCHADTRISGVAITLKEFLCKLDNYSIPHHSEKIIRQVIRKRSNYLSHSKQFFLKEDSDPSLTSISRLMPGSTRCKTCICMPKQDIPEGFLERESELKL